jgi:pimeloyl-ACP methyl ester carboxylesterase
MFKEVREHPLAISEKVGVRKLERAGFARVELDAPSGPLAVWKAGEGAPLVMVHGMNETGASFQDVAPTLVEGRTVYVFDLPGHGESTAPSSGPRLEDFVAAVTAVVDAAHADAPEGESAVEVVGVSLGAWPAALAAVARPEAVARLVLVNPLGGGVERLSGIIKPRSIEDARALAERMRHADSGPTLDFLLEDMVRVYPDSASASVLADAERRRLRFPVDELASAGVPTTLVFGQGDALTELEVRHRLEDTFDDVALLETCGHLPAQECPLEFRELLAEILSR